MKLCQGRFRLDIRKLFPQRVAGHCNWLPRKVITAPSLTEVKKCLNTSQAQRGILGVSYARQGLGSLWE